MSQRRTPPAWIRAGDLIRYIIVISMIGAIGTVLLDEFGHATEAPPMVRSLVILDALMMPPLWIVGCVAGEPEAR